LNKLQRRNFELRAKGDGKTLYGKIAYNSRSEDLGGFIEVIAPGAFTESLRVQEVHCYWQHDSSKILGRQSNDTLRLIDSPSALKFECDLDPNTTFGSDCIAALQRGDIVANSFGFGIEPGDSEWSQDQSGLMLRTVRRATLFECSPVSSPAYKANSAGIRSDDRSNEELVDQIRIRRLFAALRDRG
jgi:uncharacterized protein